MYQVSAWNKGYILFINNELLWHQTVRCMPSSCSLSRCPVHNIYMKYTCMHIMDLCRSVLKIVHIGVSSPKNKKSSLCLFCCCRYGKPGCDAETCDYFLSFRRIGTDVEFEMSADTDGWVAVGFSSDKKMVRRGITYIYGVNAC